MTQWRHHVELLRHDPDELLSVVVGRDGWVGEQLTPTDRALERRRIDFPQLSPRIGDCRLRAADGDVGSDDTMVRDDTSVVDGDVCDQC